MNSKALYPILLLVFLEWLDFSLYLYLAKSVFAPQFFPPSSYSLFLSFALFATAFLARPIGGWFFGQSADHYGRKIPLMFSAALMGVATIGIALLPNYQTIGISATWGLLLFRIGQGLALGGELNNSAMFLVEHQTTKPMVAGSWVAMCGAGGMFVGGATAALLQNTAVDWLWRVIFVVVGLLSLGVCRLRKKLHESPEFIPNQTSWLHIVQEEWRGILNIALLGAFVSVTVYICNVYWVTYASNQSFWTAKTCAWAGSISQLLSALLAIPFARVFQPQQVVSILRGSMLCAMVATPVLFVMTGYGVSVGVLIGLGLYVLTNALLCSAMFYFLYLQLPAQYRCRGVSTVWALAATIGALSLPLAEQAALHGLPWFAPVWVSFIALVCFSFLKRGRLGAFAVNGLEGFVVR